MTSHDLGHSRDYEGFLRSMIEYFQEGTAEYRDPQFQKSYALALHFFPAALSDPNLSLAKAKLLINIELMKRRLVFKKAQAQIQEPRLQSLTRLLWFYFHHEEFMLRERGFRIDSLFHATAVEARRQGVRSFALYEEKHRQAIDQVPMNSLFDRLREDTDLQTLLSFPSSEITLEEFLQVLDLIAKTYGLPVS